MPRPAVIGVGGNVEGATHTRGFLCSVLSCLWSTSHRGFECVRDIGGWGYCGGELSDVCIFRKGE